MSRHGQPERRRTLTLILGGARSGKSTQALALAREVAGSTGRVLFAATAEARDDDMATRIAAHRRERPAGWDTLEEPRTLASALAAAADGYDVVVIDCLTLWVSNLLPGDNPAAEAATVTAQTEALLATYRGGAASWIIVSNEVGLGLVPLTPLGRSYRDILGTVNRLVATAADRVTLMVAGVGLDIKSVRSSTA